MSITTTMELRHSARSGMALGGVGSGWFELRHDGRFYNWSILNNEPYGAGPRLGAISENALFFLVRYEVKGEQPRIKLLQMPTRHNAAAQPSQLFSYPWLTGIERIRYSASFPFSRLTFTDREMPLIIEMEAFSPFIPHDVKNSSLPAALFNFRIRSTANKPVHVELIGSFENMIGHDVARKRFTGRVERGAGHTTLAVGADLVDPAHDSWGTQAFALLDGDATFYMGWDHRHPCWEHVIEKRELPNIDDVAGRNYGKDPETNEPLARGAMRSLLGVSRVLKPRAETAHTFVYTWHAPNRYSGAKNRGQAQTASAERRLEGYYYANFFNSAADVAAYVRDHLTDLTARTRRFHRDFFASSAPGFVLDQINAHLNTFLTSAWLTKAGDFGIQEGMTDDRNWGPLATIDVSMYGAIPIAALFPELDLAMMRAHARLQHADGEVGHGIDRNFAKTDTHEAVHSRLDLPSQFVLLALHGYFWTGDVGYLREVWPHVTRALDYVLRERDANGDLLPDMAGSMCSYDNFPMFGAASFVASLWLAALAHAVTAARALGDEPAAQRYAGILEKARGVFDEKLWKKNYYILYNDHGGTKGDVDEGCLTDQLIGQWAMHLSGLGYLHDRRRVHAALAQILKRNRRYWGLRNCTWPGDTFLRPVAPSNWGDQGNTCWSGTELCFASFLMYEGMVDEALAVIRAVDDRYRREGLYFDHQEFGGHYYRPMGAWAIVNAMLGLTLHDGRLTFAPRLAQKNLRLFFAVPHATGHYTRKAVGGKTTIALRIATGTLVCRELRFDVTGKVKKASVQAPAACTHAVENGAVVVRFAEPVRFETGQQVVILLAR
jgi:uncharacterized protein (DUF608 family)